ncbi:MAG: hypothetical protein ABI837_11550 [Acidobacteriota bacterium]
MRIHPDALLACPLLAREIAEGLCLDINYQWRGMFKPDVLATVSASTGKCVEEISATCRACPHQPLPTQTSEAVN